MENTTLPRPLLRVQQHLHPQQMNVEQALLCHPVDLVTVLVITLICLQGRYIHLALCLRYNLIAQIIQRRQRMIQQLHTI